jgi:DNA-binding transcriptional MerR regulator
MKRGGGRRYYRPEDVDLLRGVRLLLYSEGLTIRGVQRVLKEKGLAHVSAIGQAGSVDGAGALEGRTAPRERAPEPLSADDAGESTLRPTAVATQAPPPPLAAAGLSKENRRRLESALSELEEAKRLLDQVR